MKLLDQAKAKVEAFVIPRPAFKVEPELDSDTREEYLRVATAIGLADTPSLQYERLQGVLKEENIAYFDGKHVRKFLDHKLGKGNWVWAPLRQCDLEARKGWSDGSGIAFGSSIYSDRLPLPVLLTIQKIQAGCPDANFYVSSDQTDDDPFLYVCAGPRGYVVERWDEPDFR